MKSEGFEAIAVDGPVNRHRPVGATVAADLTTDVGKALLWKLLGAARVAFVSLAPPCGTSGRAREIPMPQKWLEEGCPKVTPLRGSGEEVWGLRSLEGRGLERAKAANELYKLTADIARECLRRNIPFRIGNPMGSWLWKILPIVELIGDKRVIDVCF